jgi:hypothetical protein
LYNVARGDKTMPFFCPTCKKEFASRRGMRSHHSQVHGQSLREAKCDICGKIFKRWKDNDRFCSHACAGKHFSKLYDKGETAVCSTCRKEFRISPSHPRRFCSRECYRLWVKSIPIDKARFFALLRASKYGTGTIAKAAKVHPDEVQKLIALGKGRFPLVRKLEVLIGNFRR